LIHVTGVEAVFEKNITVAEQVSLVASFYLFWAFDDQLIGLAKNIVLILM